MYTVLTNWVYKVTVVHKVPSAHVDGHLEHSSGSFSGQTPPNRLIKETWCATTNLQLTDLSRETFL